MKIFHWRPLVCYNVILSPVWIQCDFSMISVWFQCESSVTLCQFSANVIHSLPCFSRVHHATEFRPSGCFSSGANNRELISILPIHFERTYRISERVTNWRRIICRPLNCVQDQCTRLCGYLLVYPAGWIWFWNSCWTRSATGRFTGRTSGITSKIGKLEIIPANVLN